MKADSKTRTEVINTLNRMTETYARRDLDSLLALWVSDPDVVSIGSGVDEKTVGLDEFKTHIMRDWEQSEAASIDLKGFSISAAGSVAWSASNATFHAKIKGKDISLIGRLTCVLEKRRGKWFFMQMHFSMPYSGQIEGESWPK